MAKLDVDFLYSRLPQIYRVKDDENGKPLYRLLRILCEGGFSPVQDDIEKFPDLINPDKCPDELLPLIAAILGFDFPYDMPVDVQRKYLKVAPRVYAKKGTQDAIQFMIQEMMGFPTFIYAEDIVTRSFKVSIAAIATDPYLEDKKAKIPAYRPV
jgi:phage tail-like protein